MKIIIFSHPEFISHQSMPRYTKMLLKGMVSRGHEVHVWYPKPLMFKFAIFKALEKWFGYIDQYLVFPFIVKNRLKSIPNNDTLFVFMDQALGPWVPLVNHRPHVIHCHDFLAQRSSMDEIAEHKIGWTGKLYQKMIRNGFSKGNHFISVSKKTQLDLHRFLSKMPVTSEVIYNGLNRNFSVGNVAQLKENLSISTQIDLHGGFILHVGGNHWYKNRSGVIEIYNALRDNYEIAIPLWLIGEKPNQELELTYDKSPYKNDIHFSIGGTDELVNDAYASASVLLFPSFEEGFGWPIAEAMASGCPVLTTKEAPMTEVAREAGYYIPRSPGLANNPVWAAKAAEVLFEILQLNQEKRNALINKGLKNTKRFDQSHTLDKIELLYSKILTEEKN